MIDIAVIQEMLDELFSALESVEAQNAAILQFLKDKGIASEDDLAPFLSKAATTSNVRWRATRIRVDHLLEGAIKASETEKEKISHPEKDQDSQPAPEEQEDSAQRAQKDGSAKKEDPSSLQPKEKEPQHSDR